MICFCCRHPCVPNTISLCTKSSGQRFFLTNLQLPGTTPRFLSIMLALSVLSNLPELNTFFFHTPFLQFHCPETRARAVCVCVRVCVCVCVCVLNTVNQPASHAMWKMHVVHIFSINYHYYSIKSLHTNTGNSTKYFF